ncbi:uncharacterized protein LOC123566419 [Mercenaria mercenaria]|uniref:uncharacterized protein LOC123566419 n=1 Tax=Mercenaria mercenaria TaxID=6596 RepID=UPI00234E7D4D|nr:uncharacterized protein LOC123566419 [Mercenaria mercenaria]
MPPNMRLYFFILFSEYVKEYRKLNKEIRELDYKVREEEQRSVEASLARGSPGKRRSGQSEHFDPEFDPRTIKRAQRIQQVRDMWKQLEDFDRTEAAEREVVESIVERTINKYRLDAADISVKVPDMLLRECGEEIRRRNVDNTYQGGRLNLVSVLQLWNLCLHLYLEKINEVGVPKFEEEVQKLTSQVHVQQNYAQNAQTLRQQMAERIPVLKSSIEKLRAKLDAALFEDKSPESIRTTSLGLGLVGPSPQPSFSPGQGKTPAGGIGVPKSPSSVTNTPEAANQITEQMRDAVRRGPDQLFKQPELLKLSNRPQEPSSIPKPARSQTSSRQSSRPTSARSTASSKASVKSTPKSSRSTEKQTRDMKNEQSFTKVPSPRTMMEKLQLGDSLRQEADGQEVQTGIPSSRPLSACSDRSNASSSRTLTSRSEKSSASHRSVKSELSGAGEDYSQARNANHHTGTGRKTPTDLLVEEIMGEGKILPPFNSGMEAFESHSLVRTPDTTENLSRESLTPTNELFDDNNEQDNNEEEIVDIKGPEIDLDNLTEGMGPTSDMGICDHTAQSGMMGSLEADHDNIYRELPDNTADASLVTGMSLDKENTEQVADDFTERGNDGDGSPWTEGARELNDDVIEGMIEEGIRQVTQDGLNDLEEDTVQYPANVSPDRRYEEEDVQIDNVCGPELEEDDNMSEMSMRSTEQPIVIDRSLLQLSPQPPTERIHRELSSPESPEMLIDEEKFPSLENSPREAIIIDRSFQTPGAHERQPLSLSMNESLSGLGKQSMSPGLLSMSFQGKPSPATKTPVSKDFLSRSLVMERSPLSEEIRKMFKKAVEETPPPEDKTEQRSYAPDELKLPDETASGNQGNSRDSSPGYHGNILKETDISWDLTENLDDIEIPDLDQNLDDDIDNLLEANDKILQSGGVNLDEDDGIDDFFTSKTPELPKRRTPANVEMSRTPQQGQFEGSHGEGSGIEDWTIIIST